MSTHNARRWSGAARGDNSHFARLLTAVVLVSSFVFVSAGVGGAGNAGSAYAAGGTCLSGSTFESGDGNLTVDNSCASPGEDWATGLTNPALHLTSATDYPSGSTDNSFTTGAKEDDLSPGVTTQSVPPNKNDLIHFYTENETVGGHTFLYLGFTRAATSGNADLDFEINHVNVGTNPPGTGTCTTGTATLGLCLPLQRQDGDLLFQFIYPGGGGPATDLEYWTWANCTLTPTNTCASDKNYGVNTSSKIETPTNKNGCLSGSDVPPCWSNPHDLGASGSSPFYNAADNSAAIPNPLDPTCSGSCLSTATFGEAGIDLTGSGIFPTGTCVSLGGAWARSRSSDSGSSALQDYIAPVPTNINNCGTITIIKQTSPRGGNQNFSFNTTVPTTGGEQFSITPDSSGNFNLSDNGNAGKTAGSTDAAQNSAGNTETIHNVPLGTYTVQENTPEPSNYIYSGFTCTSGASPASSTTATSTRVTVTSGSVTTCLFTNSAKIQPNVATSPTTIVNGNTITGVGTGSTTTDGSDSGFSMTVPIGSSIKDTASYSGSSGAVAGKVEFKLFFVPSGQSPSNPCSGTGTDGSYLVYDESGQTNDALSGGSATSSAYDTTTNTHGTFGTYYWQDVYTPASGSPYLSKTETCGDEQVHIMDARILLTPGQAANAVGAPHTLTATVQSTTDGTTWTAVSGVGVTFSLNSGTHATFVGSTSSCTTTAAGTCQVSITDSTAETVTINATASSFVPSGLSVGSFTRATGDGASSDSGPAVKYYVDANISISPANAINASGSPHTLTATVNVNDGSGSGYAAKSGVPVSFSLANNNAGATVGAVGGPYTAGPYSCSATDSNGQCQAQITTTGAGSVNVSASVTVTITPSGCTAQTGCSVTLTRSTGDTNSGDSPNANKQYDNARISISPLSPVNLVGNAETFTITVEKATSGGNTPTWTNVGSGTTVSYSIGASGTSPFPSDATIGTGTCPESSGFTPTTTGSGATDANGQVTVTVFACQAGKIDVHASADVHFTRPAGDPNGPGDLIITRATGDTTNVGLGGSNDAVKTYINPATQLSVTDTLTGLDPSMNGTVTYNAFHNTTCSGSPTAEGSGLAVTNGVATSSNSVTIGPGAAWGNNISFQATFTGAGSVAGQNFISPCTETASSS